MRGLAAPVWVGRRAVAEVNLRDADLSDADLNSAILFGAHGCDTETLPGCGVGFR